MRIKTIISTAAFVIAFIFSTAFANLFVTTADKISAFIIQDENNGRYVSEKTYVLGRNRNASISDYAEIIEEYVDDANDMDANDLPADFQLAWSEHTKAWREYSYFLNKTARPLYNDDLSPKELQKLDDFHNRKISKTWDEVLRVGSRYGAYIQ
jgi:hypothetical protein